MSGTAFQTPLVIPDGFTLHTENTSHILLPSTNEAFLNPIQEFNRDLSVAAIRIWSEDMNQLKEAKWKARLEKKGTNVRTKKLKAQRDSASVVATAPESTIDSTPPEGQIAADSLIALKEYPGYKFVILEALSATGLRSIRYAKEIPLLKYVIANDLSSSAVDAMKRNVELNGLSEHLDTCNAGVNDGPKKTRAKITVNEGDACTLMYSHREKRDVDVVDLDPYGTASPFIDSAVQCISDGGLLCVTCTDMSVLATTNYSEKCFSNYGGLPLKAEYCHEAGLRLVLHTISSSAARYGRFIQPLLSLSIDFYIRLFVRIQSGPIEVKKAASRTSTYYVCTSCQSFYGQPLGRMSERVHEPSGNVNYLFKTHSNTVPEKCSECDSPLHVAGPMWSGPLHNVEFVSKLIEHLEASEHQYGTAARMKGMLTLAKEELETPFYFTPSKMAGNFHSISPSLDDVASALLNAGHQVSRSHACAGSLKTTASRVDVHDVFRSWVKLHPVRMDKISPNSPARQLLSKEPRSPANFTKHPGTMTSSAQVKLVRYQQNPANWGPGTKADTGKRKRGKGDLD